MEEDKDIEIQRGIEEGIRKRFREIGSNGGRATVQKHGREYMSELGRRSGAKRRANAKLKNEQ